MIENNIDAERISKAKIETGGQPTVPVHGDPLRPDPILNQKLGWLGIVFGHDSEKAGNIAGMAATIALLTLLGSAIALIFASTPEVAEASQYLIGTCLTIVSAALGFLFGKHSSN